MDCDEMAGDILTVLRTETTIMLFARLVSISSNLLFYELTYGQAVA